MSRWIKIAELAECPPGKCLEIVAEDRIVALFNVDGNIHALDGICPHQGGPLGQGELSGCVVTCPWHGWQFDVTNGQHQTTASLVHSQFEVKIENDQILVNLNTTETAL